MTPPDLSAIQALYEKATAGKWRSHDHEDMRRFGDDPKDWIGYAWVGVGGDSDGRFDGKVACLDRRNDASKEYRQSAAPDAAFIAHVHNLWPAIRAALDRQSAALERARVIEEAAWALLERMAFVQSHEQYRAIWVHAMAHGMTYTNGPQWGEEEDALRAALSPAAPVDGKEAGR